MEKQFISLNGQYYVDNQPVFTTKNRSFRYGDALFETMHASGSKVQFFYEHIERLVRSMHLLQMEVPVRFTVDTIGLHDEISKLLVKNQIYLGGRVRLSAFRDDGGYYTPECNEVGYVIETEKIEMPNYVINRKGLKIDTFTDFQKPVNIFSNLKTANSLFFVLAGVFKKKNELDDVVIFNSDGFVTECLSSNIFVVKSSLIQTPSLLSGCVDGIMRSQIIKISQDLGFDVNLVNNLTIDDLLCADEIFLTNAIVGLEWVGAFRNRRYFNKMSKTLIHEINRLAFE